MQRKTAGGHYAYTRGWLRAHWLNWLIITIISSKELYNGGLSCWSDEEAADSRRARPGTPGADSSNFSFTILRIGQQRTAAMADCRRAHPGAPGAASNSQTKRSSSAVHNAGPQRQTHSRRDQRHSAVVSAKTMPGQKNHQPHEGTPREKTQRHTHLHLTHKYNSNSTPTYIYIYIYIYLYVYIYM